MHWFKRHYGGDDPQPDQVGFEWLFMQFGAPREMMMVADKMVRSTVYVSLPDVRLKLDLPGYEPISDGELPQEVTLVAGIPEEFDRRFPPPAGP